MSAAAEGPGVPCRGRVGNSRAAHSSRARPCPKGKDLLLLGAAAPRFGTVVGPSLPRFGPTRHRGRLCGDAGELDRALSPFLCKHAVSPRRGPVFLGAAPRPRGARRALRKGWLSRADSASKPGAMCMPDAFPEGLTFDDVLLVPQHSDVLPRDVDRRLALLAQRPTEHPADLRGDGHRDRVAPRGGARAGGRHRRDPPQPLDRGPDPRGRQGQALRERRDPRPGDAAAAPPRIGEAREIMARHNISGLPIVEGETGGRHPDAPRLPLPDRRRHARRARS